MHNWVMGSAHRPTEINNWPQKFDEYHSRGKVDVERTENSSINPMTFNCDLDLESV